MSNREGERELAGILERLSRGLAAFEDADRQYQLAKSPGFAFTDGAQCFTAAEDRMQAVQAYVAALMEYRQFRYMRLRDNSLPRT